jgi:hypothetical protein
MSRRIGSWLSILGGVLCILSYPVPWVAYHSGAGGEGYLVRPPVYGHVWSGHRRLENDLWPTIPYSVSSTLTLLMATLPLLMATLPLLMALVAMIAGAFGLVRAPARLSQGIGWIYWTASILGTLALLVMTYALDPWNLRDTALLTNDWVAPPSLGPGIFFVYAGVIAIITGGFLLRGERADKPAAQGA